jgi:hypothetical protein
VKEQIFVLAYINESKALVGETFDFTFSHYPIPKMFCGGLPRLRNTEYPNWCIPVAILSVNSEK